LKEKESEENEKYVILPVGDELEGLIGEVSNAMKGLELDETLETSRLHN